MAWKPLPLSAFAGAHLPALLISEAFTAASYTVHLTDLTHIWSEHLDRRDIVRRGREQDTSIDPSENEQLQILLEKIRLALAGGKNTSLALTIRGDADRPSLTLNINVKLPGGLVPLQWPIQLAAAPQSLMRSQFVVPLLRAQGAMMEEIASLVEVAKEKDHVIQKLLDKLEGQGTELGQIFPQAAGRVGRKVDRKTAEGRVKGLGQFDLETWQKSRNHEISRDIATLIGDVFAATNSDALGIDEVVPGFEEPDDWWESIKGITINLDTGKFSTNGPPGARKTPPNSKPPLRKEETIEDDAFQVQATPPRFTRSPEHAISRPPVISDSTDHDDDLDIPTQRSKIPDSFPSSPPQANPSPKNPKRLGMIGLKKAALQTNPPDGTHIEDEASLPLKANADKSTASPTPPPVHEKAIRPKKKLGQIGGGKEEPLPVTEPERDISPPPVKTTPAPEVPKLKKGKLGQIGGNKKRAETPPLTEEPQPEASKTSVTLKRQLGAIGHGHHSPATKKESSPSQVEEGRGRASVKPEDTKTPPPRETSEERADKKRLQLKRELEEKSKAPMKKRKKF
jgi:XLF-Cernunnos, XRcc4-like factor, NHEJ component